MAVSKIHVLIVEDSEDDAALLLRALGRGAWQVTHERVDTPEAMTAALDKGGWDLIIADYSMPRFSGPAALALTIGRASDVPFILISGVVGEEIAVQSMKAGADDYISKNNLARLLPVAEREVENAAVRREARQVEAASAKRAAHLASALQLAHVGTWHLDLTTQAAVWSDEACRIIGFEPEHPPTTFEEFLRRLYPEDRIAFCDLLANSHTGAFTQDVRMLRADGVSQFVQVRGDIVRDAHRAPLEAAGMIQDITDRNEVVRALAESRQRLLGIIGSAMDAIITVDAKLNVTLFNSAAEQMFRCSAAQAVGKPLAQLIPQHFQEMLADFGGSADCESAPDVKQGLREWLGLRFDGEAFPAEATISRITVRGQKVFTAIVRDVSERKQVERELMRVKEAAEAANRAKSEFLANMSHEIRTPMAAIIGYTDILSRRPRGLSEQQECLQVIQRNGRHLLGLINDILDISKIEAGQMTVERLACDLPQLMTDIVSMMRPRAIDKGLEFAVTFDGRIPQKAHTDPLRLRQILVNLISNAIKFTDSGVVALKVACDSSGPTMLLKFDVQDTGIGVRAADMSRLFKPFMQADESTTRRFGGTGLGLTISRHLAELLGGTVTVESEVGVGSTFTATVDGGPATNVTWALGLSEATLPAPLDAASEQQIEIKARILLAEDGRDNQRLFSAFLGDAGAELVIADNGLVALELAEREKFDLILMDMQMPELDGYGAAAELRRRGCTLPIIALTAHAMAEDRGKCIASGCSDYLSKPVDRELLLRTIAQHLGHSPAAKAPSPPNPRTEPARRPAESSVPKSGPIRSEYAGVSRMHNILADYVAGLPEQVVKLTESLMHEEIAMLQRAAHQLRGSGGGFGFSQITKSAGEVEDLLKGKKPLTEIAERVEGLVQILRRVEGYDAQGEKRPHTAMTA